MSYLPPVRIVRLPSRPKEPLAGSLKAAGFTDVRFTEAVEGAKLGSAPPWHLDALPAGKQSVRPWPQWADPWSRRAMTLGEVGCSLSHVLLWAEIAGGETPVLILEDDARPVPELMLEFPGLMDDLAHIDWDVCWLAHRNDEGPKPLVGRLIHAVDYHPVWTLAYMVTPRGAERLLASPWHRRLVPADELLPAAFARNRDGVLNEAYSSGPSAALAVSVQQRFFEPAPQSFTGSETEHSPAVREADAGMEAFAVATDETPGWQRLKVSALRYGVDLQPLGMGTRWKGGDMRGPGGGQKINLLRPALAELPARAPRALP